MDEYLDYILDHYKRPRNYGVLENPDISYKEGNPSCGDELRIDLKLRDGVIEDVRFSGHGCAISMASASILTELIKGKPVEEARHLGKEEMLKSLMIPIGPVRLKCALLALKVFKAAAYGMKGWPGEEEED
ncbi:MAG: Fe-S cluster assembly sulfur transfer protein SufU [bacterium JZ-2024 1]